MAAMNPNESIGENVHLLLRRRGISATAAGRKIGVGQTTMSRKLHGDRPFKIDEILTLCEWLDAPLTAVFEGVPTRQA